MAVRRFTACRRTIFAALLLLTGAHARRLPIQIYTIAQGLPRNTVYCLVPDPHGLLWACTTEGLVRFDGSEFRTFDTRQGLPSPIVLDLLIAKDGSYWIVTRDGVCRLPPGARIGTPCRLLETAAPAGEYLNQSIVETPDGRVWVTTLTALYRATADGRRLERLFSASSGEEFATLARGPGGGVLLIAHYAVYLCDGTRVQKLPAEGSGCGFGVTHYMADDDVWIFSECGPYRLAGSLAGGNLRVAPAPVAGLESAEGVIRRRDGALWFATPSGLALARERSGVLQVVERLGSAEGVPHAFLKMLAVDAQGNVWAGTEGQGIFRITTTGFQTYYENDGLDTARISSLFEDLDGDLCVTTSRVGPSSPKSHFKVKNGERFERVELGTPPGFHDWGWGSVQFGLQAHDGEWWFPTEHGLYRYARVRKPRDLSGRLPYGIYTGPDPAETDAVFRVFEDSHGDIWYSTISKHRLIRWDRATGRQHSWTAEGWPADATATVIRESKAGTLWIGTFAELLRLRGGRVEKIAMSAPPEPLVVRDLLLDSAGRLWVASANNGLFRCDNPEAESPAFRRYTVREGLSAGSTRPVVEDNAGFVYVGTTRGVDRIDPRAPVEGGNIRHYTVADGLPDSENEVAFRDRRGHLWFGTLHGLAEFDPALDVPRPLPPVYIRRVRLRGEDMPLPWGGTSALTLDLAPDKNQVEIEFAAADLRSASVRYQYRLDGVDPDWSPPSPRSVVNYANLPPGRRSFAVRLVGADGEIGENAARIDLSLAAPIWRRWWFLGSASIAAGLLIYWLYRYRVAHLLAVERLRTRIATDLHDDIGASLTQISLLSEVGRRDRSRDVLADIAQISRDLAREMSDIVWAVSPRHDRFDALAHRMRRFAEDAIADGELVFDASELPGDHSLAIEYRRPLFLVFKEAVNNVARHSGAGRMTVRLALAGNVLTMTIEDNGSGFVANGSAGEGLHNIRRRMRDLGGSAEWDAQRGRGTRFTATLPLRK